MEDLASRSHLYTLTGASLRGPQLTALPTWSSTITWSTVPFRAVFSVVHAEWPMTVQQYSSKHINFADDNCGGFDQWQQQGGIQRTGAMANGPLQSEQQSDLWKWTKWKRWLTSGKYMTSGKPLNINGFSVKINQCTKFCREHHMDTQHKLHRQDRL